jgi:hypothetical protein
LYAKNENDKYINFDWLFRMSSYENSMKLVDYLTLKYAPKKKDAKLFLKLIEYADDVDIEEQITNNLFSLIVNEKDIKYQLKLKKTLKKLDVDKYNMLKPFELKEELNKKLEKNPSNKNKKLKL